jgi:hypothetical protein
LFGKTPTPRKITPNPIGARLVLFFRMGHKINHPIISCIAVMIEKRTS